MNASKPSVMSSSQSRYLIRSSDWLNGTLSFLLIAIVVAVGATAVVIAVAVAVPPVERALIDVTFFPAFRESACAFRIADFYRT